MLTIGHNDPGFEPDITPLGVTDIHSARRVLSEWCHQWFSPLLVGYGGDDPEMNYAEVTELQRRLLDLKEPPTGLSRLILRGHEFWIRA
jgi:hypothetical protein